MEFIVSSILGRRISDEEYQQKYGQEIPSGVVLREGKLIPWLGGVFGGMKGPAAAVTLGRTIVVNPEARLTPHLLTHELTHVRQWESDHLFPIRYAIATLRHGYSNNPYEVEARTLATSEWPTRDGGEGDHRHG